MFSDTFYKADKYSLTTFEYVSTYERMPWKFSGLSSSDYLPNFSSDITAKLNRFFQYRYPHASQPLHDDNKFVSIEYVGDEIVSYFLLNPMKYMTVSAPYIWEGFINFCGFDSLCDCKTKIDKLTSITDLPETDIVGIHFDVNGDYAGIRLFDPNYDLDEYASNESLSKVNAFASKYHKDSKGEIDIFHNTNNLRFQLKPFLPRSVINFYKDKGYWGEDTDTSVRRPLFINKLFRDELINQEQKEFIESTCTGNSTFSIDYIVSDSGEMVDMYLRHVVVSDFKSLV